MGNDQHKHKHERETEAHALRVEPQPPLVEGASPASPASNVEGEGEAYMDNNIIPQPQQNHPALQRTSSPNPELLFAFTPARRSLLFFSLSSSSSLKISQERNDLLLPQPRRIQEKLQLVKEALEEVRPLWLLGLVPLLGLVIGVILLYIFEPFNHHNYQRDYDHDHDHNNITNNNNWTSTHGNGPLHQPNITANGTGVIRFPNQTGVDEDGDHDWDHHHGYNHTWSTPIYITAYILLYTTFFLCLFEIFKERKLRILERMCAGWSGEVFTYRFTYRDSPSGEGRRGGNVDGWRRFTSCLREFFTSKKEGCERGDISYLEISRNLPPLTFGFPKPGYLWAGDGKLARFMDEEDLEGGGLEEGGGAFLLQPPAAYLGGKK